MLCPTCRRQLAQATVCTTCGTPAPGASAPLELVLADGTRVPLVGELTIGRSRGSALWLDDPSVSRSHARIRAGDDGELLLEDAESSYGTFVDDVRVTAPVPLRDGALIRVGNLRLEVQAHRDVFAAGRTIVVPLGASLLLPAAGAASLQPAETVEGRNPRLRSGYALKRLDASEGERRWVVRELRGGSFLRISDSDARLLRLFDGTRSLKDLVGEAESAFGQLGAVRLARLLADLGDRGMLAGVEGGATAETAAPEGRMKRLFKTRERSVDGIGPFVGWIYRHGGWVLFTRPALVAIATLAVVGLGVWVALIVGRYGTPFVVAHRLVLGGLVFFIGRALLVGLHELAHGLAMESVGRRVHRAGVKSIFIFPYAFVDTSEVWFEPRRRRAAVSAAGPLSDLALAGVFSILCLTLAAGTIRDVTFQLAFAGYVAAFFNLNPFLERDGYQILADRLGVPGLRARAREELRRRLSGEGSQDFDRALIRYGVAGLGWSFAAAGIAIVLSLRFEPIMVRYAPPTVVWVVLGTLWAALFVPVLIVVGPPLLARFRGAERMRPSEADG
ncbi:MAG: putative peptide zinc metalloprotease protein [Solirubrobacteraceae bacterium]|jgi:putative peptide zinc metalloprotease protein|nr:putative peptide zinc metalloprotease protein [Solirubrobacteraceae bacterium]